MPSPVLSSPVLLTRPYAPLPSPPTQVTNDDFAAFIAATGFETENERFGWSFVFEGLLTEEILRNITQAVAGAGRCVTRCLSLPSLPCLPGARPPRLRLRLPFALPSSLPAFPLTAEWWVPLEGVTWRKPEGPKLPDVFASERGRHPVVQVRRSVCERVCCSSLALAWLLLDTPRTDLPG